MTATSTHTYTADVLDSDNIHVTSLSLRGGQISFDAGRIPHVSATLECSVTDPLLHTALEPRQSRRVRIAATGQFSYGVTNSRVFNLGIRETIPNRANGTVELRLESDEALLGDFSQLANDRTPRTLEASLRDVVNYVLDKIGATLQPGVEDADITAYWPLTNLVINPSIANDTDGYTAGSGTSALEFSTAIGGYVGPSCLRWTASGTGTSRLIAAPVRVSPGEVFSAVAQVRTAPGATSATVQLGINFRDGNGSSIKLIENAGVIANDTAWTPTELTGFTVPAGAATATIVLRDLGGASGRYTYADAFMFVQSEEQVAYFDGSNPVPGYTVKWDDVQHDSTSSRVPDIERDPAATVWRAGVSGMDFLHPLLSAAGLRLVCNESREWTLRSADYRAEGTQTHRYGINIETADEVLSREDETWFDAAVYEYRWRTPDGRDQIRYDTFALNVPHTKVHHVELETPFPGAGRAESIVRRAQGRGRTVTVSRIPTWLENTDQSLTITLDGTPIQSGIASRVVFDLDTDTVSVTSRTTDTPVGAIDLLPGTIDSLTGTINDL